MFYNSLDFKSCILNIDLYINWIITVQTLFPVVVTIKMLYELFLACVTCYLYIGQFSVQFYAHSFSVNIL